MSQSVTLNSSSYTIPDVGENDWGQNVTDFLTAIPGAVLQKSGGAFTLASELDFGTGFGLKSLYYKSRTANPAVAGQVRLGVTDVVSWRNNANGADLSLAIDAADALIFGSSKVVTVAGGFTFVGTNTYANQKGIRLSEQTGNGTNYLELIAPDLVTANVTLKLPDGAGAVGQVLSTDGVGALSWINAAGGGTINSGVAGRLAIYPSNGTTLDDVATITNTVSVAIAAQGQASVYTVPDTGSATANFVMSEGTQTIAGQKTFSGVHIISNNSTAAFTISQANAFKVDSTNALVSIGTATMLYSLYVSKSSAGANVSIAVENTESANAASHARLYVVTGGASGGDPFITLYNGVQNYSIGLDNSDSDALCITGSATLNGTNLLRLTTAGALTIAGALSIPNGSVGAVSLSINGVGTGIYSDGVANTMNFAAGGVQVFKITDSTFYPYLNMLAVINGTVTNPFYSWNASGNSGMYLIAAGNVALAAGGVKVIDIKSTGVGIGGAPSNSFLDIYRADGNYIQFWSNAGGANNEYISLYKSATDWIFTSNHNGSGTNRNINFNIAGDTAVTNAKLIIMAATGTVRTFGTADSTPIPAGFKGERITSTVSNVAAAATGVFGNITSVSLGAGLWDVTGNALFTTATGTGPNTLALSAFSGNTTTDLVTGDNQSYLPAFSVGFSVGGCVPHWRVFLSGTTTIYMKGNLTYTAGTPAWYGTLYAIRV